MWCYDVQDPENWSDSNKNYLENYVQIWKIGGKIDFLEQIQ